MISKFVFAFLFFLVVSTQAQQFDQEIARVSELLKELRLRQENVQVGDSKTDILNFSQGFLEGVGNAHLFDELKACIADDELIMTDIVSAIALIRSKSPENVKKGIQLLGQVAQMIPAAAQICRVADAKIEKLITIIKSFTNPQAFMYYVGKSLLINHVEVIHEIEGAINAYENKNMNRLGFFVGSAMATIILGEKRTLRQGLAEHINENNAGWEATTYEQFEGLTIEEIKGRFLGAKMIDLNNLDEGLTVMNYEGLDNDVPESFNSSVKWPGCVHPIRDQQRCGSCWAFAASEVMSDRFCIASNKNVDVVLSPQYLVSCDIAEMGCNGGWPVKSWEFISKSGLLTDSCLPYQAGSGVNPVKCSDVKKCADGSEWKLYYAKKGSSVVLPNPTSIQNNILKFGPVEAAFMVYEDFMHYKGGVYKHTSGGLLGGHAVKIVGWGKEEGTSYWIVANSWNTGWGENGHFRIAFGQVGIDTACVAGEADIERLNQSRIPRWF